MTVEVLSNTADCDDAREKLIHSFSGLSDDLLDEPGVVGEWSVRDCLAHILSWDDWGKKALVILERGEGTTAPAELAMNQEATARFKALGVTDFQRKLRELRTLFIDTLAAMTDEERHERRYHLDDRTISADEFIDSFIEHDLEHASHIRAWRKAKCI